MLIYKTTNLINGLIYIGQKPSMNTEEELLNSNYYGSGKKILQAINEFGKENFKREIIDESNDLKELDKIEEKWIAYYNSTNPEIGYNIAKRNGVKFWTGAKHSIESVNIIRKKLMGNKNGLGIECSKEKRRKISISNTGKIRTPEMLKNLSDAHIGVRLSDEAKRKLSEYRGEKHWNYNGKTPDMVKEKIQKRLYATYTIETPTGEIIKIESRKSVLEYLKCSEGFFTLKSFKGYKLLNVFKKYE